MSQHEGKLVGNAFGLGGDAISSVAYGHIQYGASWPAQFKFRIFCESRGGEEAEVARSFVASDYAGITAKNLDLYYGYECTDENDEWCFSARVGSTEVMKIPQSKLKAADKFDCASCLLAGIGQLFDKYGIK